MKGTLTPPGSSPLRGSSPHSVAGSTPPSPEAPPTPDSAHMTANLSNRTVDEDPEGGVSSEGYPTTNEGTNIQRKGGVSSENLVSTNHTVANEPGGSEGYFSPNQEPLTGARKRKASKVHKVEVSYR